MEHPLITCFQSVQALTTLEKKVILEHMKERSVSKGAFLATPDTNHFDTFFITKGVVRKYHIKEANEHTTAFFTEGNWIIQDATLPPSPYPIFLECLEDCTLVVGNEASAAPIMQQFPHFERLARRIVETVFHQQHSALQTYLSETPEQRYRRLQLEQPQLLQRVSQYHIASFLGIQPESLSRIRKRMST